MAMLLIIDVQKGFLNPATRHVPARVEQLQSRFETVIATRFLNPPGSPWRRFLDWPRFAPGSEETALAFSPEAGTRLRDKTRYSCIDEAFLSLLRAEGTEEVSLCGIATDNCVLATAIDLFQAGIRPLVLASACGSHGGRAAHLRGLAILARLIGERQILRGWPLPEDQGKAVGPRNGGDPESSGI